MEPVLNYEQALGDKYLVQYQNRQSGRLSGGEADYREKNMANTFFIQDMNLLNGAINYSMNQNKQAVENKLLSLEALRANCTPETETLIAMIPRIVEIGSVNTQSVLGVTSDLF